MITHTHTHSLLLNTLTYLTFNIVRKRVGGGGRQVLVYLYVMKFRLQPFNRIPPVEILVIPRPYARWIAKITGEPERKYRTTEARYN